MSKKTINQKTNYHVELISSIGFNFIFDENPINRLKNTTNDLKIENSVNEDNKKKELAQLKIEINSIEDCSLKNNSKKIILGDGNINSSIMLIGEAPGIEEDSTGVTFAGDVGALLNKMLVAINSINLRFKCAVGQSALDPNLSSLFCGYFTCPNSPTALRGNMI